jgi:hypothetical protein
MLASALIDRLEDAIAKYGDRRVKIVTGDGIYLVTDIAVPDYGDGKNSFVLCDEVMGDFL